jgi:hypothetical protein
MYKYLHRSVSNCRMVVSLLDMVEELRPLLLAEARLRVHVKAQLSRAYKEQEAYWRQRYAYRLCKLGDGNTAFFHANASARLRRNQVKVLHSGGRALTNHGDKERVLYDFYSSLLGATPWCVGP